MTEKRPLFSICIPNYNYEIYLGATIDSVLDQSFEDFEVVIQDNASTDGSWDLIQSYAEKDKRIRAYQNPTNVGFSPNLQKVTENARGEYFILLSSDDKMKPNALSRYAEVIEKNGIKEIVICADTDIIDGDGKVTGFIQKPKGKALTETCKLEDNHDGGEPENIELIELMRLAIAGKMPRAIGIFCAFAYSRKLWEKVGGYNTTMNYCPDTAFSFKLMQLRPDYIWVHERLFEYRVHSRNQTAQQKKLGNLKMEIDGYLRLNWYSNEFLAEFGIKRKEAVRTYLKGILINGCILKIYNGNWIEGFRLYCLSWAFYPLETLKMPRTYLAFIIVLLGPIYVTLKNIFN
jgi:glycosyltransferase involved in cell wall biosynthesis